MRLQTTSLAPENVARSRSSIGDMQKAMSTGFAMFICIPRIRNATTTIGKCGAKPSVNGNGSKMACTTPVSQLSAWIPPTSVG